MKKVSQIENINVKTLNATIGCVINFSIIYIGFILNIGLINQPGVLITKSGGAIMNFRGMDQPRTPFKRKYKSWRSLVFFYSMFAG